MNVHARSIHGCWTMNGVEIDRIVRRTVPQGGISTHYVHNFVCAIYLSFIYILKEKRKEKEIGGGQGVKETSQFTSVARYYAMETR